MRKVYILSSSIVPIPFKYKSAEVSLREITLEEAREILRGGFISAVGHESTAVFLSKILEIDVRPSRETVYLELGDSAIAIQFSERIGKIELSLEELKTLYREHKIRLLHIQLTRAEQEMTQDKEIGDYSKLIF